MQPVYASLGNHDSYPVMWANSDSSWNTDFLSSLKEKHNWLDHDPAEEVKTHFGAYSISNPNDLKGLKVISLNTDFWYVDNVFNFPNYTNPDSNGMLKFLITELEAAEAADERVWIIGNVPSGGGTDALPNPSALFLSIVVRFSPNTIAAIFWGHTHRDQIHSSSPLLSSANHSHPHKQKKTNPLKHPPHPPETNLLRLRLRQPNPLRRTRHRQNRLHQTPHCRLDRPQHHPPQQQPLLVPLHHRRSHLLHHSTPNFYADLTRASWAWESMNGKWSQLYDSHLAYDPANLGATSPLDAAW